MSRARILADYVSTGVTAAEFDFLDTTSGIPGSGTFLRGDKTWVAAGSTSASALDTGTLAVARMAAGTVLKNTHYAPVIADAAYTAAERTVMSLSFTPLSATNYLLISITFGWFSDGNGITGSLANNLYTKHNGVTMFTNSNSYLRWEDSNNSSNTVARTQEVTQTFYIAETFGSTTTGAARTILVTIDPSTGQISLGDSFGQTHMNIIEFA